VACCCEHGNEFSDVTQYREFSEYLRNCQRLKRNSARYIAVLHRLQSGCNRLSLLMTKRSWGHLKDGLPKFAFRVDANELSGRHARADRKLTDRPPRVQHDTFSLPADTSAQGRGLKHAAKGSHEARRFTLCCSNIQGDSQKIRNVFLRGPSAISGVCYPWMVTCSVREQRCRCGTASS
jgi:hypothetical protein